MTTTLASTRLGGDRHRHRHRRRLATVLIAVVTTITALAACEPDTESPWWTIGYRLEISVLGPHLALTWPAASGSPSRYEVSVNGTVVPVVSPSARSCVLVGLAPSTTYLIRITAYDAAGNWSGDRPSSSMNTPGWRAMSMTTSAATGGGSTRRCVPATDADADRAPDHLEAGTGTTASAPNLGTVTGDDDTDDDGLEDGDEAYGTAAGLNLPAFGVRPVGKDVLVEIDWAEAPQCAVDLQPTAALVDPVVTAFTGVSVSAMGRHGIKLIVDRGQGGVFTGGNEISGSAGRFRGEGDYVPRPDHLAPERRGYFRYVLYGTEVSYQGTYRRVGLAEVGGDEVWFGAGCTAQSPLETRQNLLMHELGHNLDLLHGGHETRNWKPNYGSIMNYWYMSSGADLNCDARGETGQQRLAFSEVLRPSIDENHIDEAAGMCPGIPADLDGDTVIDTVPYARDFTGDGQLTVLHGSNDLDHINVDAFADGNRVGGHPLVADEIP